MEESEILLRFRCRGNRNGGGDLPEVETSESWGSKHGQSYEVANGDEIDNEGEKKFIAHMLTVNGEHSGGKLHCSIGVQGAPAFDVGEKDLQKLAKSGI